MNVSVRLMANHRPPLDNPAGPLAPITAALREAVQRVKIETLFSRNAPAIRADGAIGSQGLQSIPLRDTVSSALQEAAHAIAKN